ncbi:hypothetical protein JWJ90_10755 [Desulfobulbus rhabdoformis]|uniref:hypothetical protein n=1 Tax=Desulfobulbus rhabdoformis TaxID=34032 RepID=UPI001964D72C|nr:hypothetical protein [Desulfobulbus rhabdoformis]MBM9614763.1 hypothetical protein [Desulfobulbus rhabdoformis]
MSCIADMSPKEKFAVSSVGDDLFPARCKLKLVEAILCKAAESNSTDQGYSYLNQHESHGLFLVMNEAVEEIENAFKEVGA